MGQIKAIAVIFSAYFLLHRWRDKIRNSMPLHVVTLSELTAVVSLFVFGIYLLGFFGIDFVQSVLTGRTPTDGWEVEEDVDSAQFVEDSRLGPCGGAVECSAVAPKVVAVVEPPSSKEGEEIIKSVVAGKTRSYSLESKLGDCKRAAVIRQEALQRMTGKSLAGLPLNGFDYDSIIGQCCEMPIISLSHEPNHLFLSISVFPLLSLPVSHRYASLSHPPSWPPPLWIRCCD